MTAPRAEVEAWFLDHGLPYFVAEERDAARAGLQARRLVVLVLGLLVVAAGVTLWLDERDAPLESEVLERRRRRVLAAARRGQHAPSSGGHAVPDL